MSSMPMILVFGVRLVSSSHHILPWQIIFYACSLSRHQHHEQEIPPPVVQREIEKGARPMMLKARAPYREPLCGLQLLVTSNNIFCRVFFEFYLDLEKGPHVVMTSSWLGCNAVTLPSTSGSSGLIVRSGMHQDDRERIRTFSMLLPDHHRGLLCALTTIS